MNRSSDHGRGGAAILLVLALLTLCAGSVRRVPQDYATIQSAFDAVTDDDTVLVSLGTYAEELLAPPRRFWLMGDVEIDTGDFERPTIDPSTLDSAQWRRCLMVPAGCELTIERMRFANRAPMYPRGQEFAWGGIYAVSESPLTVRYCAFDSTYGGITDYPEDLLVRYVIEDCQFTNSIRTSLNTFHGGRMDVRRCLFHQQGGSYLGGNSGTTVEDCIFTGRQIETAIGLVGEEHVLRNNSFGPIDSTTGILLRLHSHAPLQIEGNVFHDIRSGSYLAGIFCLGPDPVRIAHNLVYNITTWEDTSHWGDTHFSFNEPSDSVPPLGAIVDSNLFQDTHRTTPMGAPKALNLFTSVTATGNRFYRLFPDTTADVESHKMYLDHPDPLISLRYNQFADSEFALMSRVFYTDAMENWWGDATGPYHAAGNPQGRGAKIDGMVWFDPWCPDTNCLESAEDPSGVVHPSSFILSCYPNPFNSTLHLTLIPSEIGIVKLELFDLLGRRVSEIWHGPLAFQKDITFDASALASGIYFARVTDVISRKNLAMAKLALLK